MMTGWETILTPQRRQEVERYGKEIQEIRLRLGQPGQIVTSRGDVWLKVVVTEEELRFVVNTATRYSPWASDTLAKGFLTAPGGHRIGVCGEAVTERGEVRGMRNVTSLNIRIARDLVGIADGIEIFGNSLIVGPPGSGKTTLLRDLIRRVSKQRQVAVIDERQELFPLGFDWGQRTDVLSLCPKGVGVDMALRTLGPQVIALDEITAEEDLEAVRNGFNCGVDILATAHAGSLEDLYRRPVYRRLMETKCFDRFIMMKRDKSYRVEERLDGCIRSLVRR